MKRYVLDARPATDHFPGIGRYASNLARALPELLESDERLIILHDPARPSPWSLPAADDSVSLVATTVSPFGAAQQWRLPALLRRLQATVYHSTYYLMPYRPRVPTLLTFYDVIPLRFPALVSARARLLYGLSTRLALRAADHVVAISEAARQDAIDYFSVADEAITAVPLAPDPVFSPRSLGEQTAVRQKYRLPVAFALYLGINKPHKNLERLLQAWAGLADRPSLVIAGAWDRRYDGLRQTAVTLGLDEVVRFVGPVAGGELPALYSAASFFIFPSLYEGFGLPIVEAMACGTAVACSNRSSLPEAAGAAALLFDPEDVAAIREAARRLWADETLRLELGAQGQKQAARFSWPQTAAETLALYRALVEP